MEERERLGLCVRVCKFEQVKNDIVKKSFSPIPIQPTPPARRRCLQPKEHENHSLRPVQLKEKRIGGNSSTKGHSPRTDRPFEMCSFKQDVHIRIPEPFLWRFRLTSARQPLQGTCRLTLPPLHPLLQHFWISESIRLCSSNVKHMWFLHQIYFLFASLSQPKAPILAISQRKHQETSSFKIHHSLL